MEIDAVVAAYTGTWPQLVTLCEAAIRNAALNGGMITSYTVGGKTVTKDLAFWQGLHAWAKNQVSQEASEAGGGLFSVRGSFGTWGVIR